MNRKPKKQREKLKIQLIEWDDHFSSNKGWMLADEVRSGPFVNVSVGFVVREDPKRVLLAQSIGEGTNIGADFISIIKKCILKRVNLR